MGTSPANNGGTIGKSMNLTIIFQGRFCLPLGHSMHLTMGYIGEVERPNENSLITKVMISSGSSGRR